MRIKFAVLLSVLVVTLGSTGAFAATTGNAEVKRPQAVTVHNLYLSRLKAVPHVIPPNDTSSIRVLGRQMAAEYGWTGSQWQALDLLWHKESHWCPTSWNNRYTCPAHDIGPPSGSSGACGIPQADPCSKITDMSVAGQIRWGLDYIRQKYHTPTAAWQNELQYGSY